LTNSNDNAEQVSPSKWPSLKLRWYESWITRAAIAASLILFAAVLTSGIFLFQSLTFVADLVHDQEIEEVLAQHLTSIKQVHSLQQELVIEKLKPLVRIWQAGSSKPLEKEQIIEWFTTAKIQFFAPIRKIILTASPDNENGVSTEESLKWIDRHRLKIFNYTAEFPKGPIYQDFKLAEETRRRYQLVGAKIEESKPRIFRDNGIVLLVSAFLLASIFILSAQRFKRAIETVISGFTNWAEKDPNFRFGSHYRGELKLVTANFNAMADEVEANRQKSLYLEKIASWQIIARKLAHEIKNPLTPIQMMVSQLKRKYKGDDPDFTKLLANAQQIITEEISGLRRMVDNFSNFAQLPQPSPKAQDLGNICSHVVELQKNAFPQHNITFDPGQAPVNAKVDDDLIRQVVLNLIKNAAEACGETPCEIKVVTSESNSASYIKVIDNGPGVPEDIQARIFEAYFTTKHTGPTAGMGLGLAVCQKIILDHGGKMTLSSTPGNTTFTISLTKR